MRGWASLLPKKLLVQTPSACFVVDGSTTGIACVPLALLPVAAAREAAIAHCIRWGAGCASGFFHSKVCGLPIKMLCRTRCKERRLTPKVSGPIKMLKARSDMRVGYSSLEGDEHTR